MYEYKTVEQEIYSAIQSANLSNIEYYFKRFKRYQVDINSVLLRDRYKAYTPLIQAVQNGEKTVVDLLLKLGADINNYRTSDMRTPLEVAIDNKDVAMVKHLIGKGADVNFINTSKNKTPLIRAIEYKNYEIVEELIKNKANINQVTDKGNCALIAASAVSSEMVNFLITIGDVELMDGKHDTLLTVAIQSRKLEFAKVLLKHGADVNLENSDHKTPLWWAISHKLSSYIKLLLQYGADKTKGLMWALELDHPVDIFLRFGIDPVDKKGQFPLLLAVEKNRFASFKLMVKKGVVNINLVYPCGNTILALCAKNNLLDYVKYLLQYEPSVCKVGENGKAPLVWAVMNKNLEMVKLLLQHGAHLSLPSAFLTAIKIKNLELVKYLKEQGASVNTLYKHRITPLLASLEGGNLEIIQYLLDNQAGTWIIDKHDNTILIKWIKERNLKVVEKIVEIGANLNATGKCGSTPLTKALEFEIYNIAKCLVENGADVNLADANEKIPLSIAAATYNFHNVKLLIEHGADLSNSRDELVAFTRCNDDFDIYFKQVHSKRRECSGHEEATPE